MAAGFKGEVYAVNPRHRTIDGHPCLPSLSALPARVDLAVVVTGAQNVPGIIDEAGKKGIPAMLVLSPGLCEDGPERRQLEREVVERARAARVRVFGPNCLGLMRPDIGLNASWARTMARPGALALVSQSGAVTTALLDYAWTAGFGFSSVLATGAESDVSLAEILDYLAGDAATRSILLYVEGIHDARPLLSSIRVAAERQAGDRAEGGATRRRRARGDEPHRRAGRQRRGVRRRPAPGRRGPRAEDRTPVRRGRGTGQRATAARQPPRHRDQRRRAGRAGGRRGRRQPRGTRAPV